MAFLVLEHVVRDFILWYRAKAEAEAEAETAAYHRFCDVLQDVVAMNVQSILVADGCMCVCKWMSVCV